MPKVKSSKRRLSNDARADAKLSNLTLDVLPRSLKRQFIDSSPFSPNPIKRKGFLFIAAQCLVLVSLVSWIIALSNQATCIVETSETSRLLIEPLNSIKPGSDFKSIDRTGTLNQKSSFALWNKSSPIVQITAFTFCIPLNNATFIFPIPISEIQIKEAIALIESNAKDLFEKAKSRNEDYNHDTLLRYACFTSSQLADEKKVRRVNIRRLAPSYFPFLSYEESSPVQTVRKFLAQNATCNYKRHYKIAYVLMAHNYGLKEIKNLYSLLYEEDAFFYYHIDAKEPWFKKEVKDWIRNDPVLKSRCNSAIIPNPTSVLWGHASMVFAQLELFFQLRHLIDFDYVINLSVDHYPMKSTRAIHHSLEV